MFPAQAGQISSKFKVQGSKFKAGLSLACRFVAWVVLTGHFPFPHLQLSLPQSSPRATKKKPNRSFGSACIVVRQPAINYKLSISPCIVVRTPTFIF